MRLSFILFFITTLLFSQEKTTVLENRIYHSVDAFVAHPNVKTLEKLNAEEKNFHPRTKPEWLAFVILKCNKAYYANQFGKTEAAIADYEKAWQVFRKNDLSGYDIVESCLQPLGNLYTLTGDYDNAEKTIIHYLYKAMGNGNPSQVYAATLNLSNVYQYTGRANLAVEFLSKTLKYERLTDTQQALLHNNLGNAFFASGSFVQAQKAFETSIKLLQKEGRQHETLANAYRNLAAIYAKKQELSTALSYMEKAQAQFANAPAKTPRKAAQFDHDRALLYFMQQDYRQAQQCVSKGFERLILGYAKAGKFLPQEKDLYAETVLPDLLDLQAELFLQRGKPTAALKSYDLAFHVEDLLQSGMVYENSKIINQLRNRDRTEKCIAIHYRLYQKDGKKNHLESAFLLAEKTKSAVLRMALAETESQSREEKMMAEQLQKWNTVILKEQQKLEKADLAKIHEAIGKQNGLMLKIKSQSAKKNSAAQDFNTNELYAKLGKDKATLVEYFYGNENIAVFTLKNHDIKLAFIENSKAIKPKLLSFVTLFGSPDAISANPLAYNQMAYNTYRMLQLPEKTKHKNLIIVPDGILNFLPFEALISQPTSQANFEKMNYLLRDFTIGYSNAAAFYLNAKPLQKQQENVLGVFPIFEKTDSELAFSKKEMENLQSRFDGKYLSAQQATFANFKSNAAHYSVLHLSTHADSGDWLQPATIRFFDQEIFYSDLYHLKIKPDLVVLSACETGIGKLYKAEGAMSVARGFQFSGAQNLLFSLWKVNDYTTSVLMEKFYANLKNGQSYLEASHDAKLGFLSDESVPNAKKSPYYWAAFVYYGTLETKKTTDYLTWICVFSVIIGLLLLWQFFRKWRP